MKVFKNKYYSRQYHIMIGVQCTYYDILWAIALYASIQFRMLKLSMLPRCPTIFVYEYNMFQMVYYNNIILLQIWSRTKFAFAFINSMFFLINFQIISLPLIPIPLLLCTTVPPAVQIRTRVPIVQCTLAIRHTYIKYDILYTATGWYT